MSWPSPRVWTGVAVACAVAGIVVAALARNVVFDLGPESRVTSVKRFAPGAPDVEVDPRRPWTRIPRILPGPADSWAGGTAHALRFRLGDRPVRRLKLYLRAAETAAEAPPRLTVAVNDAPVTTLATAPGRRRYTVRIPSTALGDGTDLRLSVIDESGSWITWEQIRLIEATPAFAWAHLQRRGRFPTESAAFVGASFVALLLQGMSNPEASRSRRAVRATGPAVALLLLGVASGIPAGAPLVGRLPRWAWLTMPWVLMLFRLRYPGRRVPVVEPAPAAGAVTGRTARPQWTVRSISRTRSVLIHTVVLLVALAVSLLAAELALRVVFRGVQSAGDTRAYFHGFRSEDNSHGFRGREFQLAKPGNTYRIAVIGDSHAFGVGMPVAGRFGERIEAYLNANRRRDLTYEVLTFAKPGWDTVDHVQILRTLVVNAEPDFVLLQWYVNDFENGDHRDRPKPWPLIPSAALERRLLRSSALYSLMAPQWVRLQERLGLAESHAGNMYRRFGDPEGPGSALEVEQLKVFIQACREKNAPVGIVLFPRLTPDLVAGAYAFDDLHDRVLEVCREERITCVDLRSTFAAYSDYTHLWVSHLDSHPGHLANQLAAERLIDAFGDTWREASTRGRN